MPFMVQKNFTRVAGFCVAHGWLYVPHVLFLFLLIFFNVYSDIWNIFCYFVRNLILTGFTLGYI